MRNRVLLYSLLMAFATPVFSQQKTGAFVLKSEQFRHYVEYFNKMEDENIKQHIPNDSAWQWMKVNIPLFECPQQNFEEIFYYR